MKTILQRCKTLVMDNPTILNVKNTEIVHPDLAMTNITGAALPKIVFTPISTMERWVASGKKESVNVVAVYVILEYHMREASIMGDANRPAGQGKGIIDFTLDLVSVLRGQRFSLNGVPYLDKPTDIKSIDYFKTNLSDQPEMMISEIMLECCRLFVAVPLPGDV